MFQAFNSGLILGGAVRPRQVKANTTLIVNNTTGSATIFTLTGSVLVLGLWGEVTTVLSSNVTAAYVEMNDSSATPDVALSTGVALSAAPVGSIVYKDALLGAALKLKSSSAAGIAESTPAGQPFFTPFLLVKKTAVATTLQFTYTTTNAPSSGVIQWNAIWIPISGDGNLA